MKKRLLYAFGAALHYMVCLALVIFCVLSSSKAKDHSSEVHGEKMENLQRISQELNKHVHTLATVIGERNCYRPEKLARTVSWLERELTELGYSVHKQEFEISAEEFNCKETHVANIEVELRGSTKPDEILVIGAHYDTKVAMPSWNAHSPAIADQAGTPGADDNGSGVAATLALARMFAGSPQERTLRFVFFVNEEPPFFQNPEAMGSWKYAARSRERNENILAMLCLETLGVYSKNPQTKRPWLRLLARLVGLSSKPDYVAFLSNSSSRHIAKRARAVFSEHSSMNTRRLNLPGFLPRVAWSDDWSFWQEGYPAFSVTDTAYLRHDHYHELSDTEDKLDYYQFAEVVNGLRYVVSDFANGDTL